jgi:hypothetical protein
MHQGAALLRPLNAFIRANVIQATIGTWYYPI